MPTVSGPASNDVEDADFLGVVREHPARVGNVQATLIGRKRQAIRAGHIGYHRLDAAIEGDSVHCAWKLLLSAEALVVTHDSIVRIGEPYRAIRGYDHIVGRVETLTKIGIGNHGQ